MARRPRLREAGATAADPGISEKCNGGTLMRYHRFAITSACVSSAIVLSTCASPPAVILTGVPLTVIDGDWPSYNRTRTGDRYSPLTEINTGNVAQLRTICGYTLPEVASLQTGPLVVAGTMYFTTDTISYAIDAGNCAEKWKSVRHSETPSVLGANRGFAYMGGRLFRGTSDVHVIALDAADGHLLWDRVLDAKGPGVTIAMAPIVADSLVYVGNAGGDLAAVTGHVYALHARDGHIVWKFDAVPASGPASATWQNPRLPASGAEIGRAHV
jgi:alcohol dehydrogenase (cytochrome c)